MMNSDANEQLTIWCLLDGKAGHQNQSLGLAEAMVRRQPAVIHEVSTTGWRYGLKAFVQKTEDYVPYEKPDYIISAGHTTHVALCVLRRKFGGQSVVLMKPSLPLSLFDLCLLPEAHDLWRVPKNVISTKGVLNRVRPSGKKQQDMGLFLIGGPSGHYRWSEESMIRQMAGVIAKTQGMNWTIATSRRTPAPFCEHWKDNPVVSLVTADEVGADWLPEQLSRASVAWVSEDSISMTYEALTAGAKVGILESERFRRDRVTKCIDLLAEHRNVTRWSDWTVTGQLFAKQEVFCEADRCAEEILRNRSESRVVNGRAKRAA